MGVDLQPGGACIRCSTCDGFPCRLGAKSDAETCALGPAMMGGHVRLLTGVRIDSIETGSGDRVIAVTGERNGEPVEITGGSFVLAGGAANSAAMLLRSTSDRWPGGVANSTDLVGRNYMVHNNTHIAAIDPRRANDVVFQKTVAVN
ncbi:MAG: GMC family oxidoreductase N-terminal domain-containing protein, partial [Actinobacteria bacterium]|nr:GMC family oxidoreductase N-terminal domain-containing protein [Actinomycetota bacterium]